MNIEKDEKDCIFCKVISGEIPVHHKLFEDAETLAFLDIRPNHPGHAIVIPKDHFENIYTIPEERWCHVSLIAKKLAPAIKDATEADGINVIMNNESAGGQVIMHAHVHVIPRHSGDNFPLFPHTTYQEGEAEEVANKIIDLLK